MNNYIQKIVEAFDFNSIQDDNDKAYTFAKHALNILSLVDLGLPSETLWCKCNLGAENEYDYGDYYAWGETTTKPEYISDNYTYNDYDNTPRQLPPERDVATQKLGNYFSIPTKEQCEELITYTKNKWIENYKGTGVNGMVFKGKNGKSIFIPAAGEHRFDYIDGDGSEGTIWTNTDNGIGYAWSLTFNNKDEGAYMCADLRFTGHSIRPVFKK